MQCLIYHLVPAHLQVLTGKDEEESENAFVGGRNRWSYDSIINW